MNAAIRQQISKWIGTPLCFLFTLWSRLCNLFLAHRTPDPRNALFISLSGQGGVLMADPAMRKLHRETGANLFFALQKEDARALDILNTVPPKNVFRINTSGLLPLFFNTLRFMRWCRKRRISCTIDLQPSSRLSTLLSYLSGASSRIGFVHPRGQTPYRGSLLNFPVRFEATGHITKNMVSLVNRAMNRFQSPDAAIPVSDNETILARADTPPPQLAKVRSIIKELYPQWRHEKIVLFEAYAADIHPQGRWPLEHFASAAGTLLTLYPDILILATGTRAEKKYLQRLTDTVAHPRFLNAAGRFATAELAPLYHIATCMLTHNTGPAHFAATTSLKLFVLVGSRPPHTHTPLGNNIELIYPSPAPSLSSYDNTPDGPFHTSPGTPATSDLVPPNDSVDITSITPAELGQKLSDWLAHKLGVLA